MDVEKYTLDKKTIKQWAEEDRPREKLLYHGPVALSTAELLAILIGSGTRKMSAVDLAKHIMSQTENNLNALARLSIRDLMQFQGIGAAKAVSIVAAMELGRRRKGNSLSKQIAFTSSQLVFDYMEGRLKDLSHEEFWVLLLSKRLQLLTTQKVSTGGWDATVVDVRVIFRKALELRAHALILVHNHPSRNPRPSTQDITLTKKLFEAGRLMGIEVTDHLIIWEGGYYSFRDNGQSPY